jgi:GT2 family glycosyltransferase
VSIFVADLEMTAPMTDLILPESATGVLALVRRQGRPVGMIRFRGSGRVPAARLEGEIALQVRSPADVGPTAPAPAASIVVCTRDRPDELVHCLEGLRAHAAAGHEVVVVDNAPSDGRTRALLESYRFRYVREAAPGLNRARNRGLAEAQRDLVAFTDDDCIPDRGWIDVLLSPYSDPRVVATTGLVMPKELETEGQERFERFEALAAHHRLFRAKAFHRSTTPPSTGGVVGLGANMSFRRAMLQSLGGFDPRFDCGTPLRSSGDTEMFARILGAGGTIMYRPDALVWHRHRRGVDEVRCVVFGYGLGLHAFFAKRLLEDGDLDVLQTAPRWWLGPAVKAAWSALRGRPAAPADLVWMQLWGAMHGPSRFAATRARAALR